MEPLFNLTLKMEQGIDLLNLNFKILNDKLCLVI